jgi:DNA replication protein DnaC
MTAVSSEAGRVPAICGQHGAYVAYTFGAGPTECPACERQKERRRDLLAASGLRGRFAEATFGSFVCSNDAQPGVLAACRAFVEGLQRNEWRGLWLIGPPGTGKTHLGAAMVRSTIEARDMAARLFTAREIVRKLRATWKRDAGESEDDVIEDLAGVTLLVIDEIGVGFRTDAEAVQLFDVIDRRYQLKRPTVLLTNLAAPEVRQALGDRMYDRLRENSTVLVCSWPSHRAVMGGPQ